MGYTPSTATIPAFRGDRLGSNSAMQALDGSITRTRYEPFGAYRGGSSGNAITDRGFTGHKQNDSLGLIYMNARFYVPGIARFASADTIVPDPANPQSFNRYSYVGNNPLNFIDPSGHSECGVGQYHCAGDIPPQKYSPPFPTGAGLAKAAALSGISGAFQAAYDHYLPNELIDNYVYGNGDTYYLHQDDMAELGVQLDLQRRPNFDAQVRRLARRGGGTTQISFSTSEDALTDGTLGNFIAEYDGDLSVSINESGAVTGWTFDGNVQFTDTWNFDKREQGQRTDYGEALTWVGRNFLPGEAFEILSIYTPIYQTNQTEAVWAGAGAGRIRSRLGNEIVSGG